jgi:hypothetical protein
MLFDAVRAFMKLIAANMQDFAAHRGVFEMLLGKLVISVLNSIRDHGDTVVFGV